MEDFIEACEQRLAQILEDNRDLAWKWEQHTHDRRCSACAHEYPAYTSTCPKCAYWEIGAAWVPNVNANRLPLPEDLANGCVAGDYGGWGTVGQANAAVVEDVETVERWYVYGYTFAGGEYSFDRTNEDAVSELSDLWESFENYPVLNDDELSRCGEERMEENVRNYMDHDLRREADRFLRKLTDVDEDAIEAASAWIESDESEEIREAICYAHFGYYSVDDMPVDDSACKALALIALDPENSTIGDKPDFYDLRPWAKAYDARTSEGK